MAAASLEFTSAAAGFAADVKHLANVVAGGAQGGELVPAGVSVAQPATLVPLVAASALMFLCLQAIEGVGFVVANALRVGAGATPIKQARKRERFCTAWGEGVHFTVMVITNYRLFSDLSWYWPSGWHLLMEDGRKAAILTGPAELPYQCTREMRTYYLLEFGWIGMQMVLLLYRKRRKDFLWMAAHHVITATLILTSYAFGFFRVGVVVLHLHNLFDPFLDVAKCSHYAFKGPMHALADVAFGIGAVVFLASRLVLYPYVVYHAWFFAAGPDPIWDATVDEWTCKILLCALYPIHLFWFYLILQVAKKALIGGTIEGDERSDSDSEEDEPADRERDAKLGEDMDVKKDR